jgi:hypothetical protein
MTGELFNEEKPLITGRQNSSVDCYYVFSKVHGSSRMSLEKGNSYLSGRTQWDDDAQLDVSISGSGGLVYGWNSDGYGLPKIGKGKLSVNAKGGTSKVYFHANLSDFVEDFKVTGELDRFYAQGPSSAPVNIYATNLVVESANSFYVGTGSGKGDISIDGDESEIHTKKLIFSDKADNVYYGGLTVNGGLLGIGNGGITTARKKPLRPFLTMANGTLKADADFGLGNYGMNMPFGTPKNGGKTVIDLNGHTIRWTTGLTGGSDVTIVGDGTFTTERPGIQGIPTGKWKVESDGNVDLRNSAGFAGGLELAENTSATIDIAGTNMVEIAVWEWHNNAYDIMNDIYPKKLVGSSHLATSLTFANRPKTNITDAKNSEGMGFHYLGEFYVSAQQAGTWQFSWRSKTHLSLHVDGKEAGRSDPGKGKGISIELTEGWHEFMISFYASSANPEFGPQTDSGELAKKAAIWFKVGDGGTWPNDFTVFDTTTVPMRMRSAATARTSVRWRNYGGTYGDSKNLYLNADEHLYSSMDTITNSLRIINTMFSKGKNSPLGAKCARFDGWFYVSPEKEGNWLFKGGFDDRISLTVDGKRLFATQSDCGSAQCYVTLRAGWHKFDIRTADNTANNNTTSGAGGNLTDSHGNKNCAITFSANGGIDEAFDERYIPIAYFSGDAQKLECSGLGGEIMLAEGSSLINDATVDGWCPIYGTLKGKGSLQGQFRFTGEENVWEAKGKVGTSVLDCVTFENPTPATFAGLKNLKISFSQRPGGKEYFLTGIVDGLKYDDVKNVNVIVKDESGEDYSSNFSIVVSEGRMCVVNSNPLGFSIRIK